MGDYNDDGVIDVTFTPGWSGGVSKVSAKYNVHTGFLSEIDGSCFTPEEFSLSDDGGMEIIGDEHNGIRYLLYKADEDFSELGKYRLNSDCLRHRILLLYLNPARTEYSLAISGVMKEVLSRHIVYQGDEFTAFQAIDEAVKGSDSAMKSLGVSLINGERSLSKLRSEILREFHIGKDMIDLASTEKNGISRKPKC